MLSFFKVQSTCHANIAVVAPEVMYWYDWAGFKLHKVLLTEVCMCTMSTLTLHEAQMA